LARLSGDYSTDGAAAYNEAVDMSRLPGGDLIARGLADLAVGEVSLEALVVAIGAPRLSRLGVMVPESLPAEPEHELYARLAGEAPLRAHARYNALLRRLVSFEHALSCAAR
jgi:hypothetical protein